MKIKFTKPDLSTVLIIIGMMLVYTWFFYCIYKTPKYTPEFPSNYKPKSK